MMKRTVSTLLAFVLLILSSIARSQGPAPPGVVERKNRAPVSKEVIQVKFPRASEHTLSNGLTVLILEDHRVPTISIQYNVAGASPLFEPANMTGLATITAQMMRLGTKTRTSLQIAEAAERLGASVSVTTGFTSAYAVAEASGLTEDFDEWFGLANDVLLNPSFPVNELDQLKQRLRVSLRQNRTSATFLMNERFSRAVYGDHPASHVAPAVATIDALTPEILARWHSERYVPQNTLLGITGDVRPTDIVPKLEKLLSSWKRTDLREVLPANPSTVPVKRVFLVNRPGSVQTSILVGNIAIDRRSADYFPLVVANQILGGGPASRLFLNLREAKGYTYGVSSGMAATRYPGPWRTVTEVRTEVTEPALAELFREFVRIRDELVSAAELDDAKRDIVSSFALSLESKESMLNNAVTLKIYGFPADYWDTYPARIMAVTQADVQRVMRRYVNPENLQIVAVGDASRIQPILAKYGTIELYDTDGNRVGGN